MHRIHEWFRDSLDEERASQSRVAPRAEQQPALDDALLVLLGLRREHVALHAGTESISELAAFVAASA